MIASGKAWAVSEAAWRSSAAGSYVTTPCSSQHSRLPAAALRPYTRRYAHGAMVPSHSPVLLPLPHQPLPGARKCGTHGANMPTLTLALTLPLNLLLPPPPGAPSSLALSRPTSTLCTTRTATWWPSWRRSRRAWATSSGASCCARGAASP